VVASVAPRKILAFSKSTSTSTPLSEKIHPQEGTQLVWDHLPNDKKELENSPGSLPKIQKKTFGCLERKSNYECENQLKLGLFCQRS
jgi:hypothetical protein